jgi:poly-gamma-glutamate system protein
MRRLLGKEFVPEEGKSGNGKVLFILFALSVLFLAAARVLVFQGKENLQKEMAAASEVMHKGMEVLRECREAEGIPIDQQSDPNRTGLIGLKYSPLTTSLGQLEAKRTTTNPNFAGLVVFLLKEAGVKRGETIAVAASGSFPALTLAVLSASRAMDLRPLVISSLGASQWGANHPRFHWLRMHECLLKARVFNWEPIAVSLGGDRDRGEDIEMHTRSLLVRDIKESGIFFIAEKNLERNVQLRAALYREQAGKEGIKALVNIGGSWPSMGSDPDVLKLKPGLVEVDRIPPAERRGLIHEMAFRGIPVIHLLYIRGLVRRYGLPWDPIPLPLPGKGTLYQITRKEQPEFIFSAAAYLFLVFLVVVMRKVLQ